MKRMILAGCLTLLATSLAAAQGPAPSGGDFSLGQMTPTPEMWFYQQQRRDYENPAMMVRRKAELAAQQRQQRIAAREWYGISLARPMANPTPLMNSYSPHWAGSHGDPYRWYAPRQSTVILNAQRLPADAVYGIW